MGVTPNMTGTFMWQIRVKKEHRGAKYGDVFASLVGDPKEPGLPLGLLRRFHDSPRQGFVWTNPKRDVEVEASDLIFVLGTTRFGKLAYEEGLLPFSGREPPSTPRSSGSKE